MVSLRDDLWVAVDALIAHKLRAALTVLGLTMGVATLITVMTLVQGANLYVEQKIANLGTNVFRLAKTPFAVVDFTVVVKALKNKNIDIADYRAVAELCQACEDVGASASDTLSRAVQEQADRRHLHHRLHAQHGRYRHAHAGPGPLLHARRRPARGVCLHHRRVPGGSVLPRRRIPSAAPSAPGSLEFTVDRHVSEAWAPCWARTRTTSSSSP